MHYLGCEPSEDPVTGEWRCGVCHRKATEDCDPIPHTINEDD